jgi:hypothetical protein
MAIQVLTHFQQLKEAPEFIWLEHYQPPYLQIWHLEMFIQSAVKHWAKEVAGNFFSEGMRKLIPLLTKCIEKETDYIKIMF